MQRCTNCGAAARPGAKFCTSCGTRLNLDQAPASDWSRPAATDETLVAAPAAMSIGPDAESTSSDEQDQPTAAATDTDAAGSMANETSEAEESVASTEPQAPAATSGWSWGSTASSTSESAPVSASASSDAETAPASGTATEEPASEETTAERNRSPWSAEERPDTETADVEPATGSEPETSAVASASETAASSEAESRWSTRWPLMGSRAETVTAEAAGVTEVEDASDSPAERFADALEQDETASTPTETPEEAPAAEPSTPEPAPSTGWSWERPEADEADVIAESETIAVGSDEVPITPESTPGIERFETAEATGESPRQRAASLLDELRALLPQIASGDAVTATGDIGATNAIADRLAAARDAAGDFASLRRTLESAQQNPRDVDTMLDLVNRADRLLALLDSYERLTGEIDEAVTQLRNG